MVGYNTSIRSTMLTGLVDVITMNAEQAATEHLIIRVRDEDEGIRAGVR
jgi:hypothetical protein